MKPQYILSCLLSLTLLHHTVEAKRLSDNYRNLQSTRGLQGIVLVSSEKQLVPSQELQEVKGIQLKGVVIPGNPDDFVALLTPLYLDQSLSNRRIQEIKEAIYDYYASYQRPFVSLIVPSQNVSSGVLQIVVIEGKLGEVKTDGNCWTSSDRLKSYISLKPGETIDPIKTRSDVNFINRNPFRHVDAVYSPGKKQGTTDLTLLTRDRGSLRLYAGVDNTGLVTDERQRFFTGFTWGKAFGLDHVWTYQYTASYNLKRFQAITTQYMALLPWKHAFSVYGGYSKLVADLPFPSSTNHGRSCQASLRYTVPLPSYRAVTHEISSGADYKNTNNTLEFSELFLNFSKAVNLTQLALEYRASLQQNHYRFGFDLQLFWSPGKWLPNQSNSNFAALRPGAKNHWVYGRGMVRYDQKLPKDFSLMTLLRLQASSQNLLPSEQYGIGGFDTVRGYDERQLNMDEAILGTIEARTPPIQMFTSFRNHIKIKDSIQFLGFIDVGYGDNLHKLPGEPKSDYLLSVGPGIRYTLDPYIAARFDWGIKLHNQKVFTGGGSMVHFSVTASY